MSLFRKSIFWYYPIHFLAILYPTSLANLVIRVELGIVTRSYWGALCQKQVWRTRTSNEHPTVSVGCHYLSLPFMPASGTTLLNCVTSTRTSSNFDARSRYLGDGKVITFHRILWDIITYPCPNAQNHISVTIVIPCFMQLLQIIR